MTARFFIVATVLCAALLGLHLLATWAEGRGWIYYRKGRGRNWSAGVVVQELQSLLQPSSKHVMEESRRVALERHDEEAASDD